MKNLKIYISIILLLATLYSCKEKPVEQAVDPKFCLTDSMQKQATIDTVKNETVKNVITLSGKIEADEDKWVKVFPVVGGVVTEMKVDLGDYVTKGQVLAVIHSSEIADYQGQLVTATSSVKIAEKSLSATKEMAASGLATEKDLTAAETDLEKAKSDLKKMEQTNAIYGSKGDAIQTITAPISGYIIEKNVTDNMQFKVDGSLPFFTIANLEEVWVMANVFESDIAKIKTGYDADIKVIAYNDQVFTGKVDRIFSMLDPQSRVMKVRIKIPNNNNLLKPEMFAQINIKYDDGKDQMPMIPAQAIIFDKNKSFVMVYKDKCDIETREVDVQETIGNNAYIKSGLQPGERIISKYQLLVYDALND
ncbi:MAG: efflux RND transporter periplasmic adaptor subunit [Ferruginibacter sp.]